MDKYKMIQTDLKPIILDAAYDDPASINDVLPKDVEIGTVAIVADDSGHRYIFDPSGVWKPYVGSSGGGSSSGCALAMTDVSTTGM